MKKYLLTTAILFFACAIALNAQEEEKKKVHVKIIKDINGEVIEIDTVFEGKEEGMYFLKNIDMDGEEIDIEKIIEKLDVDGCEGKMKYIIKTDKAHSKDSLINIWHSMEGDTGDSIKIKRMVFVSKDGDKELIEIKEGDCESKEVHLDHFVFKGEEGDIKIVKSKGGKSFVYVTDEDGNISKKDHEGMKVFTISENVETGDSLAKIWYSIDSDGDTDKMKKLMVISEDGKEKIVKGKKGMVFISSDTDGEEVKVKVMESKSGEAMVWTTTEGDEHNITKEGNVFVYKTGDETFDIIKSEDGEHKIIKEVIMNKDGSIEKKVKVIVTDVDGHTKVSVDGEEVDLDDLGENVKVYKYKNDDGTITVKADVDIDIDEDEKGDRKVKKEFVKIKIYPNPTEGKFNLEFELSNKESLVVKVNNESGKTVYTKKVKKFDGSFSEEIDISKEDAGNYIIQIIQGDKTIEKKLEKN